MSPDEARTKRQNVDDELDRQESPVEENPTSDKDAETTPTVEDSSNKITIETHPVDELLAMISTLLNKIVAANNHVHPTDITQDIDIEEAQWVRSFRGKNVPNISIYDYLIRVLKYCPVTNEVFLVLIIYFDNIAKNANQALANYREKQRQTKNITKEIDDDQLFVMDSYNIHRLIIAGITVSSKFMSDIFYKNSRYAKVGGLPLEELNRLESNFLRLLDYDLLVKEKELNRYANLLYSFWKKEDSEQYKVDPARDHVMFQKKAEEMKKQPGTSNSQNP